jgi:hypothetical protein
VVTSSIITPPSRFVRGLAAVAGSPLNSEKPSSDLDANGTAVLAYPVSCRRSSDRADRKSNS